MLKRISAAKPARIPELSRVTLNLLQEESAWTNTRTGFN